jgi:ferredoxin/flavodoxin---NADP+ reductase
MPYVVTQSCCADASCVVACPVNCIHPAPGEPGFASAEMLYVDPTSCVDCGACATACPVDAIKPHTALTQAERPFVALNAEYYDAFPHPDRAPLALVPRQRRLTRGGPFRFAVVGSGPAGMYVADELLRHPEIAVDVFDRLPTPYGLVRAGVAPDHQTTKQVTRLFEAIEEQPGFDYLLGVDVGHDISHDELACHYDGVVYAVGAASDRRLGIPGEHLMGSVSATDVVGWYNGHPDKQDMRVPLDHERAVVIGSGNVALDAARILTDDPAKLAATDIAAMPWATLSRSRVREVVVLGRRGPADAAFTVPELVGLAGLEDLNVVVNTGGEPITGDTPKLRLLAELAARPRIEGRRTLVLRFRTSPARIVGERCVTGLEVVRGGETETIECGLVLRAIGYRDAAIPHDRGRVRPGVYVAGWAKRGPTGFIGTNKTCAQETVARILDDIDADALPAPTRDRHDLAATLEARGVAPIDRSGWQAIDREERRRGLQRGRPRLKLVDPDELRRVAREAGTGPGYSAARRRRQKRG